MKKALWLIVSLSGYLTVHAAPWTTPTTITYQSYNPSTGNFDLTQNIEYQLPNPSKFGPGPYPVFMITPASFEPYNDPLSLVFVSEMANRGFLAATVQYDNTESILVCSSFTNRAQGVFDAARATSAAGVLCSQANANCKKGIVTAGISQGGFLAVLAKNYAPRVKATYALSMSDYAQNIGESFAACIDKNVTAIPANRLTVINGVADAIFGGQQPLENVSGYICPSGTQQCWSRDSSGAGWYIVQNSQVKDGSADHCYFMVDAVSNCVGVGDPSWLPPATYNWSLKTNLDWLATFGTHRNFSSTGL